jgi:hypothetical protein
VLWEVLDRIVTARFSEQDFLDLIDNVERHMAMVFHRYLEGPRPRLCLSINGRAVSPSDPFLSTNPATWTSPSVSLDAEGGRVTVQSYVLPHKDVLDPQLYKRAAGPDGWTAQQGFYVYRNERLLVAGSWLGLGQGRSWTKEESHRLARIRLDIPNTADAFWKIDVRKSTARPPVSIRGKLTRLAEDARERARRVFAHRGQIRIVNDATPVSQAWRAEQSAQGIRYRIDRNHPAIKSILDEAGPFVSGLDAMLRVIEETIPVQRIWLDTAEGRETPRTGFSGEPSAEIRQVLDVLYRNMIERKGLSPTLAKDKLLHTEPFHNYPDIVAALPDNI